MTPEAKKGFSAQSEVRRFAAECSGFAAIEYAITAAVLAVAVAAGVSMLAGAIPDLYDTFISKLVF